jgi:hypothetical protein
MTVEEILQPHFPDDNISDLFAAIEKANAERKAICEAQLKRYENEKRAKKLAEKEAENAKIKKRK